ncbi:GNAT family N-acetyltransferase [Lysinibacillus sphaericus]
MIQILHSERLVLRAFSKDDASEIQNLANNKDVADIIGLPQPYLLKHALEWIEIQPELIQLGTEYPLAIVETMSNELVGTITLRVDKEHLKGELGYWIGRPYWGKGFATEAVKRMISFGFQDLGLNKVWASALSRNQASIAVLQKAGLLKEGTLKQDRLISGEFEDTNTFGIVREEYF